MTSHLDAVEQNLGGGLEAATAKASKYKKLFHKVGKKLEMTRVAVEDFLKIYQGRFREQERVIVELQRLRSDLADREAKVDRLRSPALDLK